MSCYYFSALLVIVKGTTLQYQICFAVGVRYIIFTVNNIYAESNQHVSLVNQTCKECSAFKYGLKLLQNNLPVKKKYFSCSPIL